MNQKILDHIEKYNSLSIDYQFPDHFKIDSFLKNKSFKYIPMIPNIDISNIKQYLSN
jgi:5'-3' exonuclease